MASPATTPAVTRPLARSEVAMIGGLALATLALHLATNGLYDFHRDSLYYLYSACHPAWGYVDYPPVTPTIAWLGLLAMVEPPAAAPAAPAARPN